MSSNTQTPGIDISKYQGNEIDNLNASTSDLAFVICKATEGNTYTDPNFQHNWDTIAKNGFIKGAYHFYRTNDQPQDQLANYTNAVSDLPSDALPPIVDFEEGSIVGSTDVAQIQADLLQFLSLLEQHYNRIPMIYTDVNIGNSYLDNPDFAKYPLWIANYTSASQPTMPGAWKGTDWIFWQQSDDYKIGSTANDYDLFNGNEMALKSFVQNH